MFFIDYISSASILDPQAPIINTPFKEYILDLNIVRINYADNPAKVGTYKSINQLAYSFYYL